jgi:hypothetical protein
MINIVWDGEERMEKFSMENIIRNFVRERTLQFEYYGNIFNLMISSHFGSFANDEEKKLPCNETSEEKFQFRKLYDS